MSYDKLFIIYNILWLSEYFVYYYLRKYKKNSHKKEKVELK